jgi:hypothetical protein
MKKQEAKLDEAFALYNADCKSHDAKTLAQETGLKLTTITTAFSRA